MSDNIIKHMINVGFTGYEAKAFSALTTLGEASVSKIANTAGIPRVRVYDVLLTLEMKGWVQKITTKPVMFKTVDLDVIKQKLEDFESEMKKNKVVILDEIKTNMDDVERESTEDQDIVVTTEKTIEVLRRVILGTKKELIFFRASSDLVLHFEKELKQLKRKNVDIKILLCSKPSQEVLYKIMVLGEVKVYEEENVHGTLYSDGKIIISIFRKHNNLYCTFLNYKKCIYCLSGWLHRDWDELGAISFHK